MLVIGVGNPQRGDDGVGVAAARLLRAAVPSSVRIVEHSGEAAGLLNLWETSGAACVYLIDAMVSGLPAGAVRRFSAHLTPLPAGLQGDSTHALGVAHAVELARVLACLPPRLIVYGIEGVAFETGNVLSDKVSAAVHQVVDQISAEILASAPLKGTKIGQRLV